MNEINSLIRLIFIQIKQNVISKYQNNVDWQSILSSVLFLRFFCPAIFDPVTYHLTSCFFFLFLINYFVLF